MVSMSVEKIFQRESSALLFAFWVLFRFLYALLGSVFTVFGWCSMLLCVKFNVAIRGD